MYVHGYSGWALTEHHLRDTEPEAIVLEPVAGGRWYERHADGTECDWGSVLEVDAPHRIVLAWHVGVVGERWGYDPEHGSRVTVTFTAVGDRQTVVRLEHRDFEAHGAGAEAIRSGVADADGWAADLAAYAVAAGASS